MAQGLQRRIQLRRVLGLDDAQVGARVAKPVEDALGHVHLRLQPFQVLRRLFGGNQQDDLRGPVGDGAQPQVHARAGGVPQGHRNHIRRHAMGHLQLRCAAQLIDQRLATLLAVQQQHGVLAARCGIGGQQGFKTLPLLCRGRIGIGHRARGAHRGAGAAAHAQVGVDHHALAGLVAADGLGRANVHAGAATHGGVAAVGAELLLVFKKLGLLKLAHQFAQLEHGGQVTPIAAQVALGQRVLQEGGRGVGAAHVQHQIELGRLALARALEVDRPCHLARLHASAVALAGSHVNLVIQPDGVFGAGGHAGITAGAQVKVDGVVFAPAQFKRTQPARQCFDAPAQHRVATSLGATGLAGALGEHGNVQHIRHQPGHLLCRIERPDDQQATGALVCHHRHGRRLGQVRRRQQRSDFGAGLARVTAPAAGFADVHKADGRDGPFRLAAQVSEQALFLGACHHHVLARADGLGEGARLAAAQGGMEGQVFTKRCAQGLGVQRHRLVAIADERGHVLCGWLGQATQAPPWNQPTLARAC